MILADTSVWVEHLRRGDTRLVELLENASVLMHPFIVGEIAWGSLADRHTVLALLQDLPAAAVAWFDEVRPFIGRHRLWGKGIGYADVHLLAAVALTKGATLWTRDKRLRTTAPALGCAFDETGVH